MRGDDDEMEVEIEKREISEKQMNSGRRRRRWRVKTVGGWRAKKGKNEVGRRRQKVRQ